jgi:hypothetical protein
MVLDGTFCSLTITYSFAFFFFFCLYFYHALVVFHLTRAQVRVLLRMLRTPTAQDFSTFRATPLQCSLPSSEASAGIGGGLGAAAGGHSVDEEIIIQTYARPAPMSSGAASLICTCSS